MKLNQQQLEAAQAYQKSKNNIAVLARAGTGKTSFLIAINKIRKSQGALFLAFTNATKDELIKRDPSLASKVKTTYSIGMKACGRFIEEQIEVDKYKYSQILQELMGTDDFKAQCATRGLNPRNYNNRNASHEVLSLLNSCMTSLLFGKDEVRNLVKELFFINPDIETWLISEAIKEGLTECLNGRITFVDMVAFPFSGFVTDEDRAYMFDKYPVVMIDEAQDLSLAQIRIAEESSRGGQVIIVGDRNQSIFAFAGATGNSFDTLVESFNADIYPMDLCYRCPVEVLDKARELVPDIKGIDRHGVVEEILGVDEGFNLLHDIHKSREQTLIVSRTNAKLLKVALFLLDQNIPFNFHRDAIQERLKNRLAFIKENTPFNNLASVLWAQKKEYEYKKNEYQLDTIECLIMLLDLSGASKYSELFAFMRKLFFKRASKILLGTVHSFKGDEAPNVVAWGIEEFPHRLAQTVLQLEQEWNLLYVLYTRAMERLYLVDTSVE